MTLASRISQKIQASPAFLATLDAISRRSTRLFRARWFPCLHWVKEGEGLHTQLYFFNHYDYIFPGQDVTCDLEVNFYDSQGERVLSHRDALKVYESRHLRASELLQANGWNSPFEGVAAVRIVPQRYVAGIHCLGVGSEYYASYFTDANACDVVHQIENAKMSATANKKHAEHVISDERHESSLVLISNQFGPRRQTGRAKITIINAIRQELTALTPDVPARGCRSLKLRDLFPALDRHLQGRVGSAFIESVNLVRKPYWLYQTAGGDIAIEHG